MGETRLPTLTDIVALGELNQVGEWVSQPLSSRVGESLANTDDEPIVDQHWQQAERHWQSAIAALMDLLRQQLRISPTLADKHQTAQALILSGPLPIVDDSELSHQVASWVFSPTLTNESFAQLLPAQGTCRNPSQSSTHILPLLTGDPLRTERFCLVLTSSFSLVLTLGRDAKGEGCFQFSFTPAIIQQVWAVLRSRVVLARPHYLPLLDPLVTALPPIEPHYQVVATFSRLMISHAVTPQVDSGVTPPADQSSSAKSASSATAFKPLADQGIRQAGQTAAQFIAWGNSFASHQSKPGSSPTPAFETSRDPADTASSCALGPEAELLQAMTHEIRTPLTTIRTLTRSLMKRQDLATDVVRRLKLIDRECTQQIDRFNLIFRAIELQTNSTHRPKSPLTPIALNQIFQDVIPYWQQQANRRNLTLDVAVPTYLPMVAGDPSMLTQVLTGLVDWFTHSLPPTSHIHLHVTLAGHQLKLQFQSQLHASGSPMTDPTDQSQPDVPPRPHLKSLGQLLMFQPETGGLSLNLEVTKNLFQAMGGKLTVRQRPHESEVLTVYLPLQTENYPIV